MSSLIIQPATLPEGAAVPTGAQELINFVASYLLPVGFETVTGVIISATRPTSAERNSIWLEIDENGVPVRLNSYQGGRWQALPVVIPSGATPPSGARAGQVYFNTDTKSLMVYTGTAWTTNLYPEGATEDRPTNPPDNYLFFDTTISRLIRYTSSGWTTADGAIGEIRMFGNVNEDAVLVQNPGWSVFDGLTGRFPLGRSDVYPLASEGGSDSIYVGATSNPVAPRAASNNAGAINAITIGVGGGGESQSLTASTTELGQVAGTIPNLPKYHAVLFLRKEF